MPQHLRDAARRRHDDALRKASEAIAALARSGQQVTFASVAREAGVSTDFLYRQIQIRTRIEDLRTKAGIYEYSAAAVDETVQSSSSAVRALSAKIKELQRRHRAELGALQHALAVAQGENLNLRRKIALRG